MKTDAKQRARGLGPSRAEVLEYLRNSGGAQPVGAVAAAVGLHENTARFHLDALIESGLVRRDAEPRDQPGRPRVLYRAQPVASDQQYHQLAAAMVRHFAGTLDDRGRRAEAAGEAWGAEMLAELPLAPVEAMPRLLGRLARLGFQPDLLPGPTPSIALRPCPYAELAAEHPEIVCRMHLGLMRGLLDDTGPWMVEALEPFATADTCIVRLVERAAS